MLVIENMWVYRLILCSVMDSFFEKVKASNLTTKNYRIFAKRKANTLLLISVKFNPGPTNIKYPCGECVRVVKFGPSIPSDQCDIWCHQECVGMNNTIFECLCECNDRNAMSMHQMWSPKHIHLIVR